MEFTKYFFITLSLNVTTILVYTCSYFSPKKYKQKRGCHFQVEGLRAREQCNPFSFPQLGWMVAFLLFSQTRVSSWYMLYILWRRKSTLIDCSKPLRFEDLFVIAVEPKISWLAKNLYLKYRFLGLISWIRTWSKWGLEFTSLAIFWNARFSKFLVLMVYGDASLKK